MQWWVPVVPLLSAVLGAVVGGIVVHRLTLQRETLGARRTQRVEYLLSAYRRLIRCANRPQSPELIADLESALDDIMLLGGEDEINAARAFLVQFAETGEGTLDSVIIALRQSLRTEIDLPDLALPKPYTLRIHRLQGGFEFPHVDDVEPAGPGV